MYILNKKENALLKVIVKNARIDYLRENEYIFIEESLENNISLSNESDIFSFDELFEENFDEYAVEIENIEDIFSDEKIHDVVRALTYDEKSVLFFFYVKEESDRQIAKRLFSTQEAVKSKRNRIINKIRKGVKENV
ncbi:MAG: sigma-70 family RNA polymerase sigma factor [Clostridia bacterium]|nr:sigma-70 family RNA polymerase sigma factor [Clostridia bacterium]